MPFGWQSLCAGCIEASSQCEVGWEWCVASIPTKPRKSWQKSSLPLGVISLSLAANSLESCLFVVFAQLHEGSNPYPWLLGITADQQCDPAAVQLRELRPPLHPEGKAGDKLCYVSSRLTSSMQKHCPPVLLFSAKSILAPAWGDEAGFGHRCDVSPGRIVLWGTMETGVGGGGVVHQSIASCFWWQRTEAAV